MDDILCNVDNCNKDILVVGDEADRKTIQCVATSLCEQNDTYACPYVADNKSDYLALFHLIDCADIVYLITDNKRGTMIEKIVEAYATRVDKKVKIIV